MNSVQLLQRVWQGNSLREWAIAGILLAVAFVVLLVARRVVVARLGAIAKRTPNEVDDLVVALIARTRAYFLFFVALYVASRELALTPRVDAIFETAAVLVLLVQIGVWGNGAVDFWGRRYLDRQRATGNAASIATIGALAIAAKLTLWIVVLISVLARFRVNVAALVTGFGIGGVAIALAVQNVLGDLLAALAIVFDKPFDVGDFIVVGDVSGSVEHIGLKTTRIRSIAGEQVIVSNSELLKSRIHNYKRMYERRVVFTTNVTYDTPPDVMARIPEMIRAVVAAQTPVRFDRSHFSAYTDWALRFETVYYVLDPDYTRYMTIQQNIYLELLRRFNAERIELAFPTHSVRLAGPPPAPAAPAATTQ